MSACGRLCCKSLFAPLIANFLSCRRGFRVNMWGTSSPGDKLTGDFGDEPDATSISDRGLFGWREICHPAFSDGVAVSDCVADHGPAGARGSRPDPPGFIRENMRIAPVPTLPE